MSTRLQRNSSIVDSRAVDLSAMTASIVCVLHCAALPLLVGLLPASLLWLDSEWAHRTFVLIAVPISGYAIARSLAVGGQATFVTTAVAGLVLLIAAAFAESLHDHETAITVAGAALLVVAHLSRWLIRAGKDTRQRHG